MKDEETGSIWQQVSGKAVFGPLKGKTLPFVPYDEVTFQLWSKEKKQGRVLKPDAKFATHYAKQDWEQQIAKLPFPRKSDRTLPGREIIIGIQLDGISKAYRLSSLTPDAPIL